MSNSPRVIRPGSIIFVDFPLSDPAGHEIHRPHPAIVISFPGDKENKPRYDTVIVVPGTSNDGYWKEDNKLYMTLKASSYRLELDTIFMFEQIRAIDTQRMLTHLADLEDWKFKIVKSKIKDILGLD